jgi:DinB family protein
MNERSYIATNDRERERLRALVEGLDDDALTTPVNEYWTVAGVLGHIAFWDIRVLLLADKVDRGEPFGPLYPGRGEHRGEHLDEAEAALRAR